MMKFAVAALVAASTLSAGSAFAADMDLLSKKTVTVQAADANGVISATIGDLLSVYAKFKPVGTSITTVTNKKVSGPTNRPFLEIDFKSCLVAPVCLNVEFKAEVFAKEAKSGSCDRNVIVVMDLSKSEQGIRDNYKSIDIDICIKNNGAGQAEGTLVANAVRASSFSAGMKQGKLLELLKLQTNPLTGALLATLKEKGASVASEK